MLLKSVLITCHFPYFNPTYLFKWNIKFHVSEKTLLVYVATTANRSVLQHNILCVYIVRAYLCCRKYTKFEIVATVSQLFQPSSIIWKDIYKIVQFFSNTEWLQIVSRE